MKILVTGHTGFLGGAIASKLTADGEDIYGVSRSVRGDVSYQQYSLDITDNAALTQLVREKEIEVIIHCAAKPIVADCNADPFGAIKSNALGVAAVLQAARCETVRRSIVIETDKVYGFQQQVPTPEDAVMNPNSPYEISKVLGAQIASFYRSYYGMDIISVRPVNLFGPGDKSFSRMIPNAMRSVIQLQPIRVLSHAVSMERDFLYVHDAVEMIDILRKADKPRHSEYNLSANASITMGDLAVAITRVLNHPILPEIEPCMRERGEEIPMQSIDGQRFVSEFNYTFTPFPKAIQETFDWYKENCK